MSSATAISWLREGMIAAYAVLRERDLQRQWALIAADVVRLLDASAARVYELDPETGLRLRRDDAPPVPALAEQMEAELMKLALVAEKSLISTHPQLHFELRSLAGRCQAEGIVTHVLLVRAHGRTHGAIGLHWLGRERPPYEQRAGFYSYWDAIGFAVAAALERSQIELELDVLHDRAYRDRLTGLPNALAFEDELRRHERTQPLSVLALDFDGMREANAAFSSYEAGGDVLIRAVGQALPGLVGEAAFAARLHTAGDEFAVLLPATGEGASERLAVELEARLDALAVPQTHRFVYQGASVGWATRREGETSGQALGRAIEAMRERKLKRRER